MKFKYTEAIRQGESQLNMTDEIVTSITIYYNVKWEVVETGTILPDNCKYNERTAEPLTVQTSDVNVALAAVTNAAKQWLTDTFGASNVIIE